VEQATDFLNGSHSVLSRETRMTHAVRFVAVVAVLTALAQCAPVQAQTPEIDALRALAEQGDANAQFLLGGVYATGAGVPQDDVQARMWYNLAAPRFTGPLRESTVRRRDIVAGRMTAEQVAEA